jgi:hypothetical protein
MRTEPPNEKMLLGTAFHDILENAENKVDLVHTEKYIFDVTCNAAIFKPQIQEIRASKNYMVDGRDITLSGKCDGITGNKVIDHKLTFRPNPESFFDSYQWRTYLDIFNADIFRYILYAAKQKDNRIEIYDISPITMYRYPGMVGDIEKGIRNFLTFVDEHCPRYGERT